MELEDIETCIDGWNELAKEFKVLEVRYVRLLMQA